MPRRPKRLLSASSSSSASSEDVFKKIESLEETIKNAFARLTEEIVSLRREVNKKRCEEALRGENVIPPTPFSNLENFNELEEKANQEEVFNNLVRDLRNISANSASEYVGNCWRSIMTDCVAQNFTWFGSKDKKAAKDLTVATAIRGAFQQKYPKELVATMEHRSKKYFQYAKDRMAKKLKYNSQKAVM